MFEHDDFDEALWDAELEDVTPLKEGRAKFGHQTPQEPKKSPRLDPDWQAAPQPSQHLLEEVEILHNEAKLIAGKTQSLDMRSFKQLARGEIPFTHRFDLHGYLEGDAWLATMDYIHEAWHAGHRCVLIIHGKGKGYGADSNMGVIKAQMASWLAHHPKVMAFHSAQPKDGGSGALYIFLRRNRTA